MPRHDSKDQTARTGKVRTGEWGQDRTGQPEKTVNIIQTGKETEGRMARTITAKTGQLGQGKRGWDNCGRTVRILHLGQGDH